MPGGRPATGQTKIRTLRIGALWEQAQAVAAARGETMTAVVEAALRRYVRAHERSKPDEPESPTG